MIKIYSTAFCTNCKILKSYLKTKEVAFEEIDVDIDKDAADYLIDQGIYTLPVIQNGDEIIVGFVKSKVDDLIGRITI